MPYHWIIFLEMEIALYDDELEQDELDELRSFDFWTGYTGLAYFILKSYQRMADTAVKNREHFLEQIEGTLDNDREALKNAVDNAKAFLYFIEVLALDPVNWEDHAIDSFLNICRNAQRIQDEDQDPPNQTEPTQGG